MRTKLVSRGAAAEMGGGVVRDARARPIFNTRLAGTGESCDAPEAVPHW
jgi:hypothetical protein